MKISQLLAGLGLWLSLVICGWVYAPGLSGPFLLDDRVNLENLDVLREGIHFTPDVALGNNSGPLGRPISMVSFVGSYLAADGLDPYVFKRHNLLLHLVAGSLVCWLVFLVLSPLRVADAEWVSLLAASLWMMSPLMLSTVLYVIQRMAQLAFVLVLAGLICYCKARMARRHIHSLLLLALSLALLATAVLCKETAIVGMPLLLLIEIAVFRPERPVGIYRLLERVGVSLFLVLGLLVMAAVAVGWQSDGVLSYASRDFTLSQRIMTQPRVLLDYTAGLIWPFKSGFGIFHDDFPVSRGWFEPESTIVAAAIVASVLLIAVTAITRRRAIIPSLGVLFFFLAHGTESTFFPLEIYFEHRNYLPALGLCLALAWALVRLASVVPESRTLVIFFSGTFVMAAAGSTALRASYWSAPELFSALAVTEHPRSARANIAYGTALAAAGDPALGATYFRTASTLTNEPPVVLPLREVWLYCISGQTPPDAAFGSIEKSMQSFGNPRIDEALDVLVQAIMDARCTRSVGMRLADIILQFRDSGGRLTERVTGLAAKLENFLGRYSQALRYAQDLVGRAPRSVVGNMMVAYLAGQLGEEDQRAGAIRTLRVLECEGMLTLDQQASLTAIADRGDKSACSFRQ